MLILNEAWHPQIAFEAGLRRHIQPLRVPYPRSLREAMVSLSRCMEGSYGPRDYESRIARRQRVRAARGPTCAPHVWAGFSIVSSRTVFLKDQRTSRCSR